MGGKQVEVRVPDLGDVDSVTIVEWLFPAGAGVNAGDDLIEVETEKTTFIIPAPADGVLSKIHAPRGRKVRVGEVVGSIDSQ
jgi:pyruvate/2-oxoglutarate dehydrogenase complex dihydrolipoamide acyltransferase (E2) component